MTQGQADVGAVRRLGGAELIRTRLRYWRTGCVSYANSRRAQASDRVPLRPPRVAGAAGRAAEARAPLPDADRQLLA